MKGAYAERSTGQMKLPLILLSATILSTLAVLAVLLVQVGQGFCDLVATLHAAIVAGEAVWDAIKEFAGNVTDSMIEDLPENAQVAARAVLETAKRIADFAFEWLIEPLLGPFKRAVEELSGTCLALT